MSTVIDLIDCYCLTNCVDLGFSVFVIFLSSGLVPNVIKGLFLYGKVTYAVLLFKRLSSENLCEVTCGTVIDGLCKLGHIHSRPML